MAEEEKDQQSTEQAPQPGNEADALGQTQPREEGGDNQTTKSVVAVVVGIVVVALIAWLLMTM